MTSRGFIIKGLSKSKYLKPKLLPFYPGNLPLNKIMSAYQLLDAKFTSNRNEATLSHRLFQDSLLRDKQDTART